MKLLLMLLFLGSCSSIDKEVCREVGYEEVVSQAEAFGVSVDKRTFRRTGIHRNTFATYEWWAMDKVDSEGIVKKMTSKYIFGSCQ